MASKDNGSVLMDIKPAAVPDLFGDFKIPRISKLLKSGDGSRTLQPIKNVELRALEAEEQRGAKHGLPHLQILKTHRAFSDLLHDEGGDIKND
jgi:hypothetical protein